MLAYEGFEVWDFVGLDKFGDGLNILHALVLMNLLRGVGGLIILCYDLWFGWGLVVLVHDFGV